MDAQEDSSGPPYGVRIAWDIDGTLIDSEPTHQAALIEVCARYGVAIDRDHGFTGTAMEQVFEILKPRLPAGN